MKAMKTLQAHHQEIYVADLAKSLDRSVRTIKEWEKKGLIPKARRDSRGWRIYTAQQAEKISKHVKRHRFFLPLP